MAEAGVVSDAVAGSSRWESEAAREDWKPRKLKPGPALPPEVVHADQRRRLQGAVLAMVDESGCQKIRIRRLVQTAGVSTASLYRHFANVDECLASACGAVIKGAVGRAASTQRRGRDWRTSLEAAVGAFLEEIAADPRASRVALLDIFSAGPSARERIPVAFAELEGVLAGSFATAPEVPPTPRHLIAAMTAGLLRVARGAALAGRIEELPERVDQVTGWMTSLPHPEVASLLMRRPEPPRREPHPFPEAAPPTGEASGDRVCLLRAVRRLALNEGFASLTAARIRAEAGVTRRRFEETFADADACFLDAIETTAVEEMASARAWSKAASSWTRQTCRVTLALSAQAARRRNLARLTFIEIFAPGRTGVIRRERLVSRTAAALRATVPADRRPSVLTTEASVAAAWHLAQADIANGRACELPTVSPLLSYVILAPIIGAPTAAAAARAEVGWS